MPQTVAINQGNQVAGTTNEFKYDFPNTIAFKKGDRIALQNLSIFYSWPNITSAAGNNTFSFIWYSGAGPTPTTVSLTLPNGFYDAAAINAYLQSVMIANGMYLTTSSGSYVYFIEVVENLTLYSLQWNLYAEPTDATITANGWIKPSNWPTSVTTAITPQLVIAANAFRNVVGLAAGTYPPATQATNYSVTSTSTPQITPVSSVCVLCSLLDNKAALPNTLLYNFSAGGTTYGNLITVNPSFAYYNPIGEGNYSSFTIQFTDQNFNALGILDDNLTIILSIETEDERAVRVLPTPNRLF